MANAKSVSRGWGVSEDPVSRLSVAQDRDALGIYTWLYYPHRTSFSLPEIWFKLAFLNQPDSLSIAFVGGEKTELSLNLLFIAYHHCFGFCFLVAFFFLLRLNFLICDISTKIYT